MGFIRGVIAGVAVATAAAAWYMSRAGEKFRDQYRVDRKLGALGDEIDERTRDVRARAAEQVADLRAKADEATPSHPDDALHDAEASAAEAAAQLAADVEAQAAKVKKKAESVTED
jgi:gas vesicle protein